MSAQAKPSDSLVFECDFDEPPEKVWRALTEPELLQAWLTAEEQPQPRKPEPADCEILTAEPHRLVRYRWRDRESGPGEPVDREVHSVVTVELAPGVAGGTHLRLTHGEFRVLSAAPVMATAQVTPITNARRCRTPTQCLATQSSWRRAA